MTTRPIEALAHRRPKRRLHDLIPFIECPQPDDVAAAANTTGAPPLNVSQALLIASAAEALEDFEALHSRRPPTKAPDAGAEAVPTPSVVPSQASSLDDEQR